MWNYPKWFEAQKIWEQKEVEVYNILNKYKEEYKNEILNIVLWNKNQLKWIKWWDVDIRIETIYWNLDIQIKNKTVSWKKLKNYQKKDIYILDWLRGKLWDNIYYFITLMIFDFLNKKKSK